MESIKLHIGCGMRNFGDRWVHIDAADFPHIKYKDVTKLPFEDSSVDIIYASHLIAYWNRKDIIDVFQEWIKVLKPKGILRLATPDFKTMARLYIEEQYPLTSFLGPMYGKMFINGEIHYHKTVWDFPELKQVLLDTGFKKVKKYNWQDTDHSHIDDHSQAYLPHFDRDNGTLISLNIEAIK